MFQSLRIYNNFMLLFNCLANGIKYVSSIYKTVSGYTQSIKYILTIKNKRLRDHGYLMHSMYYIYYIIDYL